jgi:hypothetical protein
MPSGRREPLGTMTTSAGGTAAGSFTMKGLVSCRRSRKTVRVNRAAKTMSPATPTNAQRAMCLASQQREFRERHRHGHDRGRACLRHLGRSCVCGRIHGHWGRCFGGRRDIEGGHLPQRRVQRTTTHCRPSQSAQSCLRECELGRRDQSPSTGTQHLADRLVGLEGLGGDASRQLESRPGQYPQPTCSEGVHRDEARATGSGRAADRRLPEQRVLRAFLAPPTDRPR